MKEYPYEATSEDAAALGGCYLGDQLPNSLTPSQVTKIRSIHCSVAPDFVNLRFQLPELAPSAIATNLFHFLSAAVPFLQLAYGGIGAGAAWSLSSGKQLARFR